MLTKVSATVQLSRVPWKEGKVDVGVREPIKLKVWNSILWRLYDIRHCLKHRITRIQTLPKLKNRKSLYANIYPCV
jgi:hypothetical protein